MRPETPEPYDSPLDEVLARMPEEAAPADLEARCLAAIRDLDSRARFARRRPSWKPVALAAAAGLAISFVGLAGLLDLGSAQRALPSPPAPSAEMASPPPAALPPAGGASSSPQAVTERTRPDEKRLDEMGDNSFGFAKPETAASLAPPPDARSGSAAVSAPAGAPGPQTRNGPAPAIAGARAPAATPPPPPTRGEQEWYGPSDETHTKRAAGLRREPPSDALSVPLPPDYPLPPVEAGPKTPWYDSSSERQRIVHTILSLLVHDVQSAYERSRSIIEEAQGFIEQEDLRLERGGPREAHLSARVPTDRIKGVVAQLRELGEVKLEKTESQDVTRDYRAQGASIRELGATEDDLVRRYLATTDPETKRRLYQEIQGLRARNRAAKDAHLRLSEETHLSYLELTLTEKTTPLKFLGSAADHVGVALGWIAVTAFFWLPLLVLAVIWWRRRGPGA